MSVARPPAVLSWHTMGAEGNPVADGVVRVHAATKVSIPLLLLCMYVALSRYSRLILQPMCHRLTSIATIGV